MKILIKNLALFVFLSVGFSGLASCSKFSSIKSNNNAQVAADTANHNSPGEAEKTNYQEIPARIMQADLKSLDGTTFKLEDYKGKVVLINFWATWCGPCKAEMPELVKLQEENKEKGLEIIGVNSDVRDSPDAIKIFGEKMNLNYKLAQSDGDFFENFLEISGFGGIPQSFLIDREGRLHEVFLGGGVKTLAKMKKSVGELVGLN
jgi:thiol-disulfide isomerase/thioredoxin